VWFFFMALQKGFLNSVPEMKIAIVGPGAMGCLFAGLLAEAGQEDVWLLDRNEQRAREIAENGLRIEDVYDKSVPDCLRGARSISGVKATANPQEIGVVDLVLICVKSYDTEGASHSVSPAVGGDTTVLTLQNGLTNVEVISHVLGADRVIAGVTSHGATMLGSGHVRHAGVGRTIIGEPAGGMSSRIKLIADILTSAGIRTEISRSIYDSIWTKLIINAAINPLTAITRLKNGELLEHDETGQLLSMTAEEAAVVARSAQPSLSVDDATSIVEAVCRATSSNISSMLQDILRQRRTEIGAINGAIVSKAKEMGGESPINETLTYLVKGIESGWQSKTNPAKTNQGE
jgi:2-dehydropantoate 2-reductase